MTGQNHDIERSSTTQPKVLVIEDNSDDEELMLRALRHHGLANDIDVVRDGQEALDYLLNAERPLPSLVLLDLKLPKVSGLEVLTRIRADERTRLVPVAIMTTSSEDVDVVESYSRGANCYVRKPVDFDRFVDAVRTLGLFWLVVNEPPRDPRDVPIPAGPAAA